MDREPRKFTECEVAHTRQRRRPLTLPKNKASKGRPMVEGQGPGGPNSGKLVNNPAASARRYLCPRAAAQSVASAKSSQPTRLPAPARCQCPSSPAQSVRASAHSPPCPTAPALVTVRSAPAGACPFRRSPARPTRACHSTAILFRSAPDNSRD